MSNQFQDLIVPQNLFCEVIARAAIKTVINPENSSIVDQTTLKLALEAAGQLEELESEETLDSDEEEALNQHMTKMVRALIEADPGLCDVGIQQIILGTGDLNGSTVMTEADLQSIIDRVRKPILTVEEAHQRIVDVRIKVQKIIDAR